MEEALKIYIVGSVASGKTTLARKLSKVLDIPHYELDCIVHPITENGRSKRTPDEQVEEINRINILGKWIIEGTYRKSCHSLFELADAIIYLDTPLWKRKYRILLRYMKQQIGLEKCHYESDFQMLKHMVKWTNDFENNRDEFEEMLNQYSEKLLVLKKSNALNLARITTN